MPTDENAASVMYHAEVITSLGEHNTGHAAVSFAAASLAELIDRIERDHPDNYGFSVYRDDTGFIYPSALYQEFTEAVDG